MIDFLCVALLPHAIGDDKLCDKMDLFSRMKKRIRTRVPTIEAARARAKRRKAILSKAAMALPYIQFVAIRSKTQLAFSENYRDRLLLAAAGYLQFLLLPLPLPQVARDAYIDENAIQPGQVRNGHFTGCFCSSID